MNLPSHGAGSDGLYLELLGSGRDQDKQSTGAAQQTEEKKYWCAAYNLWSTNADALSSGFFPFVTIFKNLSTPTIYMTIKYKLTHE